MNRRDFMRLCAYSSVPLLLPFPAYARTKCSSIMPFIPTMRCVSELDASLTGVSIDPSRPHAERWCWAACIEMIFRYQRHPVSKERIVREAWGDIGAMPGDAEQILAGLKRPWKDDKGTAFTVSGGPVTPYAAMQRLALDKPLIVGAKAKTIGAKANAMVLASLTYLQSGDGPIKVREADVQDPWPGRGKHALSMQEWKEREFLVELTTAKVDSGGEGLLNG